MDRKDLTIKRGDLLSVLLRVEHVRSDGFLDLSTPNNKQKVMFDVNPKFVLGKGKRRASNAKKN